MAEVQQQQILPAPFIQAAAEQYFPQLAQAVGGIKSLDVSRLVGPQFVAGASPLQQQAEQLATGLGGYQPFLQAAQAATGPQAYQAYMSPYQQQVIDTTLRQYDIQAAKGLPALAAQAIGYGAFGGGREGIQRAEYQTQSDLNRALLQAQLQQQGLTQAQQQAQQNYLNQLNLAGQTQGFLGQQISGLSALGAQQQAQQQALLSAQQQLAQKQAYQPLEAAQIYGAGIAPLIAGYPGRESVTQFPSPTGLQTALGVAGTLASIYGKLNPPQSPASVINVQFPKT
jgi:Arc/MetJ-type ribon-helix-helix transcriptional regulator